MALYLGNTRYKPMVNGAKASFMIESQADQPIFHTYLVFDGIAYIDTDYTPNSNDSFRCLFGEEKSKVSQQCFRIPMSNNGITGMILGGNTSSSYGRQVVVYYGSTNYVAYHKLAFSYSFFSFYLTPKRYGWGDQAYTFTKGSETPTGPITIGTNPAHTASQPYTGLIGTFRVYGSDAQNVSNEANFSAYTPVATFRPCTYKGEAGLWHVETNTFCGNIAGVGTLTVEDL